MIEGEIIKFYRKKVGLTQEQLSKGICSVTHISKIERGQTAYSPEIIELFSERLQIDIENEIRRFESIEKLLHRWHHHIVMQRFNEMERTKKELEKVLLIHSSKYAPLYKLLQARYFLLHKNSEKALAIMQQVQHEHPELSHYERNLSMHIWGIYYMENYKGSGMKDHQKAIKVLLEIDTDVYRNPEYYYHLAVAYYFINSNVMAYAYAEKSLGHFKQTNNYLWALNAESLMLAIKGDDVTIHLDEIKESYQNLILDSEKLNAPYKKSRLLNNLAYAYYVRKDYRHAKIHFDEALQIVKKSSIEYISLLNNYVTNCLDGKLLKKTMLQKMIHKGIALAAEMNSPLYKTLFKLLSYRLEEKGEEYFQFLEKKALPYFRSNKHMVLTNRHGKELYHYFVNKKEYEKAVQVSAILLENV
ncbi:helix-turn-helix domain-containing protein [Heyndrickxia acidicola]|uniref:Helix-turn-helix domain-containing protein n=1 Tax=Heyndrickxia acidicola TaxID=209389 RepID=A0ABU6MN12_9BACI|nr:helix-turn-helix transcriptional regulator [Heyndrickxia acidicola]MED1205758.1 helix-turn-helix domain-containing protein [Heyndrickxia acidicola]